MERRPSWVIQSRLRDILQAIHRLWTLGGCLFPITAFTPALE
jgi:hypothetical protein